MVALADHPDGTLVTVWVVPGAKQTEIVGTYGDAVKVRVTVPPEGGKANAAVERLLSDVCGGDARLVRGATSRRKTLLVRGVASSHVEAALLG